MNLMTKNALAVALLLSTTVTTPGVLSPLYAAISNMFPFSGGFGLVIPDAEKAGDELVEAVTKAGAGDAAGTAASQVTSPVPNGLEQMNEALNQAWVYGQGKFESLQNYADAKLETIKNIRLGDYLTYGFVKKAALAGLAVYGLKALWDNYRNGGKGAVVIHNRPQFNPVIHNNIDPQVLKAMVRDAVLDAIDEA